MHARDLLKMICNTLLLVAAAVTATASYAQAWKAGQSQLMAGKYAAAETSLTNAYRQSKSMEDKAISLKYLGVALFMQKKEAKAANIFHMALKYDPRLKLTDNEVADESVIPFFNRQKGAPATATSARTAAANPASSGRALGRQGAAPSVKKSKKTLVRVESNVNTAQISIDGIAYGSAGSDIEVKPGIVILEVTAPGYIKRAVKINVAPLTSNTLTVNLEKPQPKAPPPPPPKPNAVAKGIPLPSTSGLANGAKPVKGKAAATKGTDLFATDPADDFSSLPAQPPQQQNPGPAQQPLPPPNAAGQAQAIAPPAAPQQPVLPPGAYGSPYQPQPMYMAPPQPMYQQPTYPPPMYQQPMYQQPMYPQPMYQQPMYPQPMYQQPVAPPSVYSPGVGGGYSQQPLPPTAGPVYDPLGSAPPVEPPPGSSVPPPGAPSVGASDPGMPPPMILPSAGKGKKNTVSSKDAAKSGGCGAFIKLLPFGAGQFCQKSYMKGTLFLGTELGALYFYKQNSDYVTTNQAKLNKYAADRDANRPSSDTTDYDQETDSNVAAAKAKIAQANQNATYSLMIFGGSWALGVADAFLFPPSPPKAKKASKKMKLSLLMDPVVETNPKATLALLTPMTWAGIDDGVWYAGYSVPKSPGDLGALKIGVAWDL